MQVQIEPNKFSVPPLRQVMASHGPNSQFVPKYPVSHVQACSVLLAMAHVPFAPHLSRRPRTIENPISQTESSQVVP